MMEMVKSDVRCRVCANRGEVIHCKRRGRESEKQKLIRQYAAGEATWRGQRESGFEDYVQALTGLAELGLRPPVAAMLVGARLPQKVGHGLGKVALPRAPRLRLRADLTGDGSAAAMSGKRAGDDSQISAKDIGSPFGLLTQPASERG